MNTPSTKLSQSANSVGRFLYLRLIRPKAKNEDQRRGEYVLNIFLLGSIVLTGVALIVVAIKIFLYRDNPDRVASGQLVFATLLVFVFLYVLSRFRFSRLAAFILVGIYFALGTYTFYAWSILIPQGLLVYALVVVMSGILVSTRFAFFSTLAISASLLVLSYLQAHAITHPDTSWKDQPGSFDDATVFIVSYMVIMIASWLSNRETERSLRRARKAESALKKERDQLEIKVQQRTKELQRLQAEKIFQLYRFAEFGRMASGLLHDLANPLSSISLNIEHVESQGQSESLKKARDGIQRMERFIQSARKQVQQQKNKVTFAPDTEIQQVIDVLTHKAREAKLVIDFTPSDEAHLYGDPIKFQQVVTNLLANAIDAYEDITLPNRHILLTVKNHDHSVQLKVTDQGVGIAPHHLPRIFDPFFTTKSADKGTGIGLSICKEIVEKEFKGTITVQSKRGIGTTFFVTVPIGKDD